MYSADVCSRHDVIMLKVLALASKAVGTTQAAPVVVETETETETKTGRGRGKRRRSGVSF